MNGHDWHYETDRDDREPAPPQEDPAERAAREKLGVGKAEWRVLQGRSVSITDLKEAQERDQKRAAKGKR